MGRPAGSPNKDKPFAQALRMEIAAAGDDQKELRAIARTLLSLAKGGELQAIQQVADRLDGKPAQESTVNVTRTDIRERTDAELAEILGGTDRGGARDEATPLDPSQLN